jgi:O-antigen/teichoic acid export membrane protein
LAIAADKFVLDPRRNVLGGGSEAGYLAKGLSATLAVRLTTVGLSFLTLIVLSRLLGPEGYGQYAYVMATVAILTPLLAAGMPSIVVREIAACRSRGDYARMEGIAVFAGTVALVLFLGLSLVFFLLDMLAAAWSTPAPAHLLLTLALLLLATLAGLLSAIQQGLKRIVAAQVPSAIVQPLATVILLLLAWSIWRGPIGVEAALLFAVLAGALALAVAAALTRRAWRQARLPRPRGWHFDVRGWTAAGLSLALLGVLSALYAQVDIILVRWLAGPEATGIFHIATRNAYLLTLLLTSLLAPLGPLIAELHVKGDRAALQRVVRRSVRVVFLLTLPVAFVMIVAGGFYLELFGAGFAAGHTALAILALAQLVNVGAGPVHALLVMTGHQARIIPAASCGVLANIALNLALVPSLGIDGAASATAVAVVLSNLLLVREVRRCLQVRCEVWHAVL